ncbi:MAG: hypothetical protein BWX50_01009 [Euryarchaeota archaeon ADurb.Bin009]|nr:MAG: hypothetical protein BWX50_01009 [Euryarchaeota archaeon ADurb.Bin009]
MDHRASGPSLPDDLADVGKVCLERFRRAGKPARDVAVQTDDGRPCIAEEIGGDDAPRTVAAVQNDRDRPGEADLAEDRIPVHGKRIDGRGVPLFLPPHPVRPFERLFNRRLLPAGERRPVRVEQFDPVVGLGVMRGGDHASCVRAPGRIGDRRCGRNAAGVDGCTGREHAGDDAMFQQFACRAGIPADDEGRCAVGGSGSDAEREVDEAGTELLTDSGRAE